MGFADQSILSPFGARFVPIAGDPGPEMFLPEASQALRDGCCPSCRKPLPEPKRMLKVGRCDMTDYTVERKHGLVVSTSTFNVQACYVAICNRCAMLTDFHEFSAWAAVGLFCVAVALAAFAAARGGLVWVWAAAAGVALVLAVLGFIKTAPGEMITVTEAFPSSTLPNGDRLAEFPRVAHFDLVSQAVAAPNWPANPPELNPDRPAWLLPLLAVCGCVVVGILMYASSAK